MRLLQEYIPYLTRKMRIMTLISKEQILNDRLYPLKLICKLYSCLAGVVTFKNVILWVKIDLYRIILNSLKSWFWNWKVINFFVGYGLLGYTSVAGSLMNRGIQAVHSCQACPYSCWRLPYSWHVIGLPTYQNSYQGRTLAVCWQRLQRHIHPYPSVINHSWEAQRIGLTFVDHLLDQIEFVCTNAFLTNEHY